MSNNIEQIRLDLSVRLTHELKEAWQYCYEYLFTNDSQDVTERLETYRTIIDWYDSGVMATTPFMNITMGYTLAKNILPASMLELGVNEMQEIYLKQGREAVLQMLEELEQEVGE